MDWGCVSGMKGVERRVDGGGRSASEARSSLGMRG